MEGISLFLSEALNKKALYVENAVLDACRYELPAFPGIYFVFAGAPEKHEGGFVIHHPRLIYIGESKNIYERHNDDDGNPVHEHYTDFVSQLKEGEELCYAYARTTDGTFTRKMVESALIYHFQPIINDKSTKGYNHRDTEISISSKYEFPYIGTFHIKHA